jgi:Uma2 family endonuclease
MPENLPSAHIRISEEDYLAGELTSEIKHEYIDGYVYAMAGSSRNHERIAGNVFAELGNFLKKTASRSVPT